MKTKSMTLGIAAALVVSQALPAQAINREWSAVAGFVGGVLVANSVRCNRPVVYQQPVRHVVYQPVYQPVQTVIVQSPPVRSGYYELRTERVWVPGNWIYEDRGCGNYRKVWQPGYYQTVQQKVWVDTGSACGGW